MSDNAEVRVPPLNTVPGCAGLLVATVGATSANAAVAVLGAFHPLPVVILGVAWTVLVVAALVAAAFERGPASIDISIALSIVMILEYAAGWALVFAGLSSMDRAEAFSEHLSLMDAAYFTLSTFTTTGFGDITPKSPGVRAFVVVFFIENFLVVGVAGVMILSRLVTAIAGQPASEGTLMANFRASLRDRPTGDATTSPKPPGTTVVRNVLRRWVRRSDVTGEKPSSTIHPGDHP